MFVNQKSDWKKSKTILKDLETIFKEKAVEHEWSMKLMLFSLNAF